MFERAVCVLSNVKDKFLPKDTIKVYLMFINFHKHKEDSIRFVQSSSTTKHKQPTVKKLINGHFSLLKLVTM